MKETKKNIEAKVSNETVKPEKLDEERIKQNRFNFSKLSIIISSALFAAVVLVSLICQLTVDPEFVLILETFLIILVPFVTPLLIVSIINLKRKSKGLTIAGIVLASVFAFMYVASIIINIDILRIL